MPEGVHLVKVGLLLTVHWIDSVFNSQALFTFIFHILEFCNMLFIMKSDMQNVKKFK